MNLLRKESRKLETDARLQNNDGTMSGETPLKKTPLGK